jgi:hypothetical protein
MEYLNLNTFKENVCDCGFGGSGEAKGECKGTTSAVVDFYAAGEAELSS